MQQSNTTPLDVEGVVDSIWCLHKNEKRVPLQNDDTPFRAKVDAKVPREGTGVPMQTPMQNDDTSFRAKVDAKVDLRPITVEGVKGSERFVTNTPSLEGGVVLVMNPETEKETKGFITNTNTGAKKDDKNPEAETACTGNATRKETSTPIYVSYESDSRREAWTPVSIKDLPENPPMDWIVEGYLARGRITELVGIWKGGKTTFVAELLNKMRTGGKEEVEKLGS